MNKREAYDTDLPKGCDKETALEWAYEAEQGARSMSPWEFLAQEINSQLPKWRVDGLWQSYENGVSRGIDLGLKARGL